MLFIDDFTCFIEKLCSLSIFIINLMLIYYFSQNYPKKTN